MPHGCVKNYRCAVGCVQPTQWQRRDLGGRSDTYHTAPSHSGGHCPFATLWDVMRLVRHVARRIWREASRGPGFPRPVCGGAGGRTDRRRIVTSPSGPPRGARRRWTRGSPTHHDQPYGAVHALYATLRYVLAVRQGDGRCASMAATSAGMDSVRRSGKHQRPEATHPLLLLPAAPARPPARGHWLKVVDKEARRAALAGRVDGTGSDRQTCRCDSARARSWGGSPPAALISAAFRFSRHSLTRSRCGDLRSGPFESFESTMTATVVRSELAERRVSTKDSGNMAIRGRPPCARSLDRTRMPLRGCRVALARVYGYVAILDLRDTWR